MVSIRNKLTGLCADYMSRHSQTLPVLVILRKVADRELFGLEFESQWWKCTVKVVKHWHQTNNKPTDWLNLESVVWRFDSHPMLWLTWYWFSLLNNRHWRWSDMSQPLCRNFVPSLNGNVNSKYPSPMHVSETVYFCSYQLFATERKMPGSHLYLLKWQ